MTSKSLTDYAYEVLSESKQESMTFQDIFKAVLEKAGDTNLDEQEVKKLLAKLYTQLSIDGRFAILKDSTWGIRSRFSFDKTYIDTTEAYLEEEIPEEDRDQEEVNEEKEENGELVNEEGFEDEDKPTEEFDF